MTFKYKPAPQLAMSGRAVLLMPALVVGSCSPDSNGNLEPTGAPSYGWGHHNRDSTIVVTCTRYLGLRFRLA
jgi:hypothetical protein